MSRRVHTIWATLMSLLLASTGCHPQQPFYLHEDGDLSHYIDVATELEYPDVCTSTLAEVEQAVPPLALDNLTFDKYWDLSLEDAVKAALENAKVMRSLGGRFVSSVFNNRAQTGEAPDAITQAPDQTRTVYDPAIVETTPFSGVEYALSAFDTQWSSGMFYQKNDHQQNVNPTFPITDFFRQIFQQDTSSFNTQLTKITAQGGQFSVRNNIVYDFNNNPTRQIAKDWNANYEVAFNQPLLAGAGAQFNRIAGPYNPFNVLPAPGISNLSPAFDGVLLARINVDISLADFEGGVRNLVSDTENAYWELSFAWRNLETSNTALVSAQKTWQKIYALYQVGTKGGEAKEEAQAREQYFQFKSTTQNLLNELLRAENRLRWAMGLSTSDGRFIRPTDRPTVAKVEFDWREITEEALARNLDLRRQKWQIKRQEYNLLAAKNLLMPRLDVNGTYRWLGLGDELFGAKQTQFNPNVPLALTGSSAYQTLASGQFQEWALGAQFTMPIGFRKELATVRHFQLQVAKERAKLQDEELELSHQLADAIRQLKLNWQLTQTNFNRTLAAVRQVEAVQAAFEAETVTLDQLLEAQRRRAEAQSNFFRTLLDYQRAIITVHYRKGSLLEYNNVYLTEGPWPAKANFDAHRLARQRDAGLYLNYGFTRPSVMSQGPVDQGVDGNERGEHGAYLPTDGVPHRATSPEVLPAPSQEMLPEPDGAVPTARSATGPTAHSATVPTARNASVPTADYEFARISGESERTSHSAQPASPAAEPATTAAGQRGFEWGSLGLDGESAGAARTVSGTESGTTRARASSTSGKTPAAGRKPVSRVAPAPLETTDQDGSLPTAKPQQWKSALKHESVENQPTGPTLGSAASGQGS